MLFNRFILAVTIVASVFLIISIGAPKNTFVISSDSTDALKDTYTIQYKSKTYDCYEVNGKMHFGKLKEKDDRFIFRSSLRSYKNRIKKFQETNPSKAKKLKKKRTILIKLCKIAKVSENYNQEPFIQLTNGNPAAPIATLQNGTDINESLLDSDIYTIEVPFPAKVGSLRLSLNGKRHIDSQKPFSFPIGELSKGDYVLKLEPFLKKNARSLPGNIIQFNFKVSAEVIPDIVPEPAGVCGPASRIYDFSESAYSQAFCATPIQPEVRPNFPEPGKSVGWTCKGSEDVACKATRAAIPQDGQCGEASQVYQSDEEAYIGRFCYAGTSNPLSPEFPKQGQTIAWACSGIDGGESITCFASRKEAPPKVDGQCGTASAHYPSSSTSFKGALCSVGVASPSNPTFPQPGSSTTWTCLGQNNGANKSCTATRAAAPVAGVCGPANGTYAHDQIKFNGDFCNAGTVWPSKPSFPVQGETVTWYCNGSDGGSNSKCYARRLSPPIDGLCGSAQGTYEATASKFKGDFCFRGDATPSSPIFPQAGQSVTWTCSGENGGAIKTCLAERKPYTEKGAIIYSDGYVGTNLYNGKFKPLDNSGTNPLLVSEKLTSIGQFNESAIDKVNDLIYFTDRLTGRVHRTSTYGTQSMELDIFLDNPVINGKPHTIIQSLTVNPHNGDLFFVGRASYYADSGIFRVDSAGTKAIQIVDLKGGSVVDISYDPISHALLLAYKVDGDLTRYKLYRYDLTANAGRLGKISDLRQVSFAQSDYVQSFDINYNVDRSSGTPVIKDTVLCWADISNGIYYNLQTVKSIKCANPNGTGIRQVMGANPNLQPPKDDGNMHIDTKNRFIYYLTSGITSNRKLARLSMDNPNLWGEAYQDFSSRIETIVYSPKTNLLILPTLDKNIYSTYDFITKPNVPYVQRNALQSRAIYTNALRSGLGKVRYNRTYNKLFWQGSGSVGGIDPAIYKDKIIMSDHDGKNIQVFDPITDSSHLAGRIFDIIALNNDWNVVFFKFWDTTVARDVFYSYNVHLNKTKRLCDNLTGGLASSTFTYDHVNDRLIFDKNTQTYYPEEKRTEVITHIHAYDLNTCELTTLHSEHYFNGHNQIQEFHVDDLGRIIFRVYDYSGSNKRSTIYRLDPFVFTASKIEKLLEFDGATRLSFDRNYNELFFVNPNTDKVQGLDLNTLNITDYFTSSGGLPTNGFIIVNKDS